MRAASLFLPFASRPAFPGVVILAMLLGLFAVLATPTGVAAQTDLIAELSGADEVPGPGDPDGAGFSGLHVDPDAGELCVFIEVLDIATATAAHIHEGVAGVAGDIVVTLPTPNEEGFVEDCVTGLDTALLQAFVDDPAAYYVNVHNAEFPAGAVRGQLDLPPPPPIELFADLTGAAEIPGPGDPDGSGFASIALFVESGEVCAFLEVIDIEPATAAHIHVGAEGVAGGVVVTLPTPDGDGIGEGCTDGHDPAVLQSIADDPAGHYVNVHTAGFPAGAVRGQLSDEPPPPPTCDPGVLCNGEIAPGTYTFTRLGTDVTFTTVSPWLAELDEIPSLTLYDPEFTGGLFAWSFSGEVFADPCDLDSATTIGTSPADLIGWLSDRSFLSTTEPTAVTYGGASGLQVDVNLVTVPVECTDPPFVALFVLPIYGDFHFDGTSVARVAALDVAGETVLVVLEHWAGGDATPFIVQAQGVLDSFVWALPGGGGATPTPSPSSSAAPLPDTTTGVAGRSPSAVPWLLGGLLLASAFTVMVSRRRT